MVKRIKPHVNSYCTLCKAKGNTKVRAEWRISYDSTQRACHEHKINLQAVEEERRRLNSNDPSEADYQTWLRL